MIRYRDDRSLTATEFVELLRDSTLGERRPLEDAACIESMLEHADLTVTAWDGDRAVGVARSVTDWAYCCYLSDLAVARSHQRRGIGRGLIDATRTRLGPRCKLILLSAPAAVDYYPRLGFTRHGAAFVIDRDRPLD